MNSIEWLTEIPRRFGSKEFLFDVCTKESVTFQEMHDSACRIGADLRRRGLRKGDRVLLLLNNSAAFAKLYFGCLYAGIVVVPVNPVLSKHEIKQIASNCDTKLMVVSAETMRLVEKTTLDKSGVDVIILDDGRTEASAGAYDTEVWNVNRLPAVSDFEPFEGITADDTISLVFTSGTTGVPSGVVHRISDMIENARLFNQRLGIDETNRFYGILAMTYLGGYYNLLVLPYCAGASVVLSRAFDARAALNFWDIASDHDVNTLWLVPTILAILMEMDRGEKGKSFCRDHVKLSLVGTAPLPLQLRKEFESRYGVQLFENYGLSETFFITTESPTTPTLDGCVGRLLPGVQLTVTDGDGKAMPYGEEGELRVCTPYLMEGYYNLENRSVEAESRAGWFSSGDVGILTATGDVYITGRKKNLIIRGGINISPAEIENIIYRHEAVAECAVVGVPHPITGEDVAAAVRLRHGELADCKEEILALCRQHLGAVKQPAHLVELEVFPHSSTGKVQHREIREILANKMGIQTEEGKPEIHPSEKKDTHGPLMLPGRIRRDRPQLKPSTVRGLKEFPTSIISDVMNRLGMMDAAIRPLVRGRPFCGRALTVEEVEAGNLMSHAASEMIEPGDVLVIDAKGVTTRACWGGLQTLMAEKKDAAALVINGTVRDYETIVERSLPVYAIGVSPGGPLKGWGGNINCPIACAGVVVNPGDIVVGDDDGVVVVPNDLVEAVLECCHHRREMEETWFTRVQAGEATMDVVGLRSNLDMLGLRIEGTARIQMAPPQDEPRLSRVA